jgi:hypothetical protein
MLDRERLLFQLPVYRLSFDAWAKDEERRAVPHRVAQARFRSDAEARVIAQMATGWQPWEYNEIIAWVSVEGFHDVVKAYLWKRKGSRVHRHPTHPFEWIGKLTEMWISADDTNEQITVCLRQQLIDEIKSTPGLGSRFVDLSTYDRVAPYLDWHGALTACER